MAGKKPRRRAKAPPRVAGVLGVGLDGTDGHTRVTRTDEMVVVGGSAETHERMQETAIRFGENLEKRGKTLRDASVREVVDLLRDGFANFRSPRANSISETRAGAAGISDVRGWPCPTPRWFNGA